MSSSTSTQAIAANFGKVTVVVSDAYFMAEPAAAVTVSASSHLRTASGGAHDVTRVAEPAYQERCDELLQGHPDGLPQGSARLTGKGEGIGLTLTGGKRKVIQAITLRYFNAAFAVADEAGTESVLAAGLSDHESAALSDDHSSA